MKVKMENVGGYSVHIDYPEKENMRPNVDTGAFAVFPIYRFILT